MVDTGVPWVCAACGTPNAGYRRRCPGCGARKPDAPVTAEPSPEPVRGGEIPMPRLARRPRRRLGRVTSIVLSVVVVGLAAYGAVSYFGADRPSAEDDEAALVAALPVGTAFEAVPLDSVIDFDSSCTDELEEARQTVEARGTAAVRTRQGDAPVVLLVAFDSSRSADRFDELLLALGGGGCTRTAPLRTEVEGRVWVATLEFWDAAVTLEAVLDRLELEG